MRQIQAFQWGITGRLVLVAALPALIMFLLITAALYVVSKDEATDTAREHGQLLATALAESSEFWMSSGNELALERNARRLLKADAGIFGIEIQNAEHRTLVSIRGTASGQLLICEHPIASEIFDMDPFGLGRSKDPQVLADRGTRLRTGPTIGFARITMTDGPILAEKLRRVFFSGIAVLFAALTSTVVGLLLAQRLRAPLRTVMTALREIRQGQYEVDLTPHSYGEIGELQMAIEEMGKGLAVRRSELESLVTSRTQELQLAVDQAAVADSERRELIARSNSQVEEERRRIAREIHDHLNASLIGLRSQTEIIADLAAPPGRLHEYGARLCDRSATLEIDIGSRA
jgi:two-component system sensor histidine kinase UhpB